MRDARAWLDDERLLALRRTGLLDPPPVPELGDICRQMREQLQVPVAMITVVARDKILVRGRAGTDLDETPRLHQFCDETIQNDSLLVVPDATRDPRFASNPMVVGAPLIRFYAGAPLIYQRDLRLGALCLLDTRPRDLSLGDRAELEAMADEVVSVLIQREVDGMSELERRPGRDAGRGRLD